MSWDCPMCKTENVIGSDSCKGCGAEVERKPDLEDKDAPDEPMQKEEIDRLEALSQRFDSLLRGKTLDQIVQPDWCLPTEVYLKAATQRITEGQYTLLTSLLVAVSWGIFVAENRGSKLTEDLTQLH